MPNAPSYARTPSRKSELENATLEPDGTLVLWNAQGSPTEVSVKDQINVVALILAGRFGWEQMVSLIEQKRAGAEISNRHLSILLKYLTTLVPEDEIQRYTPDTEFKDRPAVLFALDADLCILSIFGEGTEAYGIAPYELRRMEGRRISDLSFVSLPGLRAVERTAQGEAVVHTASHTMILGRRWEFFLRPLYDSENDLVGVIGVAYEKDAMKNKQPDFTAWFDPEGRVVEFGVVRAESLWLAPHRFLHKKVQEVMPWGAAEALLRGIGEVLASGEENRVVFSLPYSDGDRYLEANLVGMTGDRVVGFFYDVTTRAIPPERRDKDRLHSRSEPALTTDP
jgi:hypothetical protein